MTLRKNDLIDLVDNIVEIDSYASKMGSDADIVTVAIELKTKEAALDMVDFLEKGFPYVLDADVTAGEQDNGYYKVFVEIERNSEIAKQLFNIITGIMKLTNIPNIRYRYYKNFRSKPATLENLAEVPATTKDYATKISESSIYNYSRFFDRSYVDLIEMKGNEITISKKWADPLLFEFIDVGPLKETLSNITESYNTNDFAEIIFLSKYIGDYNITKYGNKLTFENDNHLLVLKRL